ncbi:unnamed protein product [Calypogeia fissa]
MRVSSIYEQQQRKRSRRLRTHTAGFLLSFTASVHEQSRCGRLTIDFMSHVLEQMECNLVAGLSSVHFGGEW